MAKPIALAADHGGFELKEAVKAHLDELGLEYIDFGTHSTASVDYPDMALPACDAVVSGQCDKAPAATTMPTPCAWAAALSAPALPASWWICS